MLAKDQYASSIVSNPSISLNKLNKLTHKPVINTDKPKNTIKKSKTDSKLSNDALANSSASFLSSALNHNRSEKSLTSLTSKFMNLLQESQNGVLDLRNVSSI